MTPSKPPLPLQQHVLVSLLVQKTEDFEWDWCEFCRNATAGPILIKSIKVNEAVLQSGKNSRRIFKMNISCLDFLMNFQNFSLCQGLHFKQNIFTIFVKHWCRKKRHCSEWMCQMFKLATHREVNKWWVSLIPSLKYSWNNRKFESHTSVYNQIFVLLGFRWPSAAKTLAGLLGDDQSASRFSGTMKSFPDLGLCICESMNKISLLGLFLYSPTC